MTLAFSFPAERTAPPKDLETRPRQVKAWIDTLPLSRTVEAARELVQYLAATNRAKLDLDTRVQILDACRPVSATLLDELQALYVKAPLPLASRPREALGLARDLAGGMATGYKIALVERSARRLAFGGKKSLAMLSLRAIEYLSLVVLAAYKSYTPVPVGSWRELHRVYLHADAEGCAREVVDAGTGACAFDAYAEALLLSLTDPYKLVQGEMDRIAALARSLRGQATLGRTRPPTRPGGHFIVPCDTDRPPKPALSANDDTGGPNWRLLDANAVVDRLRAREQALESGNVSATMSRSMGPEGLALLKRLVTLWGDPPRRAFRRDPVEGTVAICVGLRAVGHFVSFEPRLAPGAEREALRKGITMPLVALPTDESSQAIPVFEWSVVNQSAGGLKVRRTGETPQPIAVGEVVGIKFGDRARWIIGAVRWITMFEEGGMEFGIEFLGSMATPVWVQPTISNSPQARQGLLLAFGDEATEADSLLTPANTFSDLREFELDHGGQVTRVRAGSLIEKTGRFELFHFSVS